MKNYLLIAIIAVITGCKSNTKKEVTVKGKQYDWDTTTLARDTANPAPVNNNIVIESFGGLKLGQHYKEALAAIGEPDTKSKAEEWGADGLMHEDWTWKSKGMVLNMSSEKASRDSSLSVFSITATAPCNFKTKAGIGVGSTSEDVQEAYKGHIDPISDSKEQIIAGSVYGGIIFTFKNNKAVRIFLGAAAE